MGANVPQGHRLECLGFAGGHRPHATPRVRRVGLRCAQPAIRDRSRTGFKSERRLPMLPLSRETTRVDDLKQSLPLCRLIFGQPRQEELLEFLKRHSSEGTTAASAPTFGKIADRARAF
jgi:hypothetical protein